MLDLQVVAYALGGGLVIVFLARAAFRAVSGPVEVAAVSAHWLTEHRHRTEEPEM